MESERRKAIKEGLQLKPEESAIVVLRNTNTGMIYQVIFHFDDKDTMIFPPRKKEEING